jgi:hypothetical protein
MPLGESKTSPRRFETAKKVKKAIQLRIAGKSYDEIARILNYNSPQAVSKAVLKALRDIPKEKAEELRTVENQRLDALQDGVWPRATFGDVEAVMAMLKLMERRAKLNGLDMPTKVAHTDSQGNDDPTASALELLRSKLGKLASTGEGEPSIQSKQ